ncbi:hypothetical protein VP01_3571g1 [Puccinia sorghi]|uniref:Uncharacterized protein n=1 Tax=Puccinia sorghi TaxID=27349 RepID=A0A0L6UW45_9BASI|nr:hypothetical protein VP01_3571g1 [Puccinia sorghi]
MDSWLNQYTKRQATIECIEDLMDWKTTLVSFKPKTPSPKATPIEIGWLKAETGINPQKEHCLVKCFTGIAHDCGALSFLEIQKI